MIGNSEKLLFDSGNGINDENSRLLTEKLVEFY